MGEQITFADIFKSSFVNQASSTLNIVDVFITISITFVIALFIFFIYKKTYQGILYTKSFNIALIVLALVTSLVIMAISSNIVLSLGMVGALSIVRFRTAIKDPIDIVYMFWAIAVGILSGGGMYLIAVSGSLFIGAVLVVFTNSYQVDKPYLLVLSLADIELVKTVIENTRKVIRKFSVKSKTVSDSAVELTLEVRMRSGESEFVNGISKLDGVKSAILVSYNGDYIS